MRSLVMMMMIARGGERFCDENDQKAEILADKFLGESVAPQKNLFTCSQMSQTAESGRERERD